MNQRTIRQIQKYLLNVQNIRSTYDKESDNVEIKDSYVSSRVIEDLQLKGYKVYYSSLRKLKVYK